MAERLLEFLEDRETFVSGQEIADALGISRSAVWKAVNRIRAEGYDIEAVPRKGYRILKTDEAFGYESIRSALKTSWLGKGEGLYFQKRIDSTNEEVKRRAEAGAEEGLIVVSDEQTGGKGRRGRSWSTPSGVNIAMSYLLKPDLVPDIAPMMTLIMALSCVRAINVITGINAGIKWPNDIVINGRKAVGILTEMALEEDYIKYIVIGTGINVNQKVFPEEIAATATSLSLETERIFSRAGITAECAYQFERYYGIFKRDKNLSSLKDEYNSECVNTGNRVKVLDPKGEYEGTASGINDSGSLMVETVDGKVVEVYSGEVSVRGVYGYV